MDELIAACQVMGIEPDELNKPFTIWRFETLHVRGVDQLTSEDIYNYFGPIHPHSIEWLSNISCNVTFDSSAQACNALQSIATALIIHKNQNINSGNETANLIPNLELEVRSSDSLEIPVPPNYRYILGSNHEKAKSIIVRFATLNDKKITTTVPSRPEPMQISNSISTNARERISNLRSNRLNRNESEAQVHRSFNSSRFKSENSNFRMRMRADEEEQDQRKRQAISKSLSSRIGSNDVDFGSRFRSNGDRREGLRPLNRFRAGHHPTSVSKSKNHIWRRSFPSNGGHGQMSTRNDLRERLSTNKNAIVRVRVSYDDW